MKRGLIEASPVPNRFCSLPVGNLASPPIASPLPELRRTLYLPRIRKSPGPDAEADAIAWTSSAPAIGVHAPAVHRDRDEWQSCADVQSVGDADISQERHRVRVHVERDRLRHQMAEYRRGAGWPLRRAFRPSSCGHQLCRTMRSDRSTRTSPEAGPTSATVRPETARSCRSTGTTVPRLRSRR